VIRLSAVATLLAWLHSQVPAILYQVKTPAGQEEDEEEEEESSEDVAAADDDEMPSGGLDADADVGDDSDGGDGSAVGAIDANGNPGPSSTSNRSTATSAKDDDGQYAYDEDGYAYDLAATDPLTVLLETLPQLVNKKTVDEVCDVTLILRFLRGFRLLCVSYFCFYKVALIMDNCFVFLAILGYSWLFLVSAVDV
jgi:hypothetical protein